jgi:gamma-glutamyltranspeptidase/glutathione hydrolase
MAQLLAAAIGYARNGFPIHNEPAFNLKGLEYRLITNPSINFDATNTRQLYLNSGKALAEGDVFKNPQLAMTLEKIAKGGRDAFYKGDIAKTIESL